VNPDVRISGIGITGGLRFEKEIPVTHSFLSLSGLGHESRVRFLGIPLRKVGEVYCSV